MTGGWRSLQDQSSSWLSHGLSVEHIQYKTDVVGAIASGQSSMWLLKTLSKGLLLLTLGDWICLIPQSLFLFYLLTLENKICRKKIFCSAGQRCQRSFFFDLRWGMCRCLLPICCIAIELWSSVYGYEEMQRWSRNSVLNSLNLWRDMSTATNLPFH